MASAELGVGELDVMQAVMPEVWKPIAVVVAAASALEGHGIFAHLPVDPDCCYLIYLLPAASKEEDAAFANLPANHSGLPVVAARAGVSLRQGHVFVLPSGRSCTLNGTRLVAAVRERERAAPLDTLLCAVAREYGQQAIVALAAPVGVEGGAGLDAIRGVGGTVVAHDELDGEGATGGDGVPVSASSVFPSGSLAAALAAFLRRLRAHDVEGPLTHEEASHLDGVLTWVRIATGHDFNQHKRSAVIRRVQRRMAVAHIDSLEAYLDYLKDAPAEAEHLAEDLLIGVTSFFQDPDALTLLAQEAIPDLMARKPAGSMVRLWVPGCSSGEEAYSLAFVFMDFIESNGLDLRLQIFATDIDDEALRAARRGTYPADAEAHIPRDLLRRYMHASEGVLRISKRVRDCVIFSSHDVLKDPPFSKLDLISCRNVRIHLSSELQTGLISRLHYALLPGGYLFLGPEEGLAMVTGLFSVTHVKQRIFRRREPTLAYGFPLESSSSERPSGTRRLIARSLAVPSESAWWALVERMLEEHAPVCVVINEQLTVVHFLGNTSKYLQPPEEAATLDLLELAHPGLRAALRACVHQAATQQGTAARTGVELTVEDELRRVDIVVRPLADAAQDGLYWVIFQESHGAVAHPAELDTDATRDSRLRELELALKRTRGQLQTVIEEFETSNEELKSSNEELLSMNEELQSSNEELETAKGELQSVNDKLERVNAELESKVGELASANNDIRNLFESTRIATLFLDNQLRVKSFTPAAGQLFDMAQTDRGRPIAHIVQRFHYEHLQRDASEVIRTLQARETQIQSQDGRWSIMRILPYRSEDNVIEGAVVTFSDISELKWAEHEIQRLSEAFERQLRWLKAVVDVVPVGIAYHEQGLPGVRINRAAAQVLQVPFDSPQTDADSLEYVVFPGASACAEHAELQRTLITDVSVRDMEIEVGSADGARHLLLNSATLVDASRAAYGQVSAFLEITDIKRAREQAVAREQQQAVIAELGLKALEYVDLSEFLLDGLKTLCRVAHVDACDVMELADSSDKLLSVCRLGWNTTATEEPLTADCAAFTAVHSGEPIFFQRTAECNGWPRHLLDEGLESGVRIVISRDGRQPFGLLGAYTRSRRPFSKADRDFLRAVALVITSAVQRQTIEEVRLTEREAAALRRSEEQLRRAERLASLGTFAAGIAHELNNPLNNISLAAEYAEQSSDQDRRDKLLSSIKSNADRCGQIVDSVLRFARNEVTQRRAVDANTIVRRAVDLVRAEFGADRLSIRLNLEDELPNIWANPTELEQAFVNLIRNAGQAHPGLCSVEIKSVLAYPCVSLTVSDDGPGISAADLPRVFDPFFSTRRKRGGTGLGLSITHRIVTSHGGRIRIATAIGGGAQFAIELPLALEGSRNDRLTNDPGADRRG